MTATFYFSIFLYKNSEFKESFELIKDKEIFNYQHLINLLNSGIESYYKSLISKKIINSLSSETEYKVRIEFESDKLYLRSKILISLANYFIESGNAKYALELVNQIDNSLENDYFKNIYHSLAISMVNGENYLFNDYKLKNLFVENGEYINPVSYTHLTLPTNREV